MFSLANINTNTVNTENSPVIEVTHPYGGHHVVLRFPNNLGASVVRHQFSYGGRQGLWELAVIGFSANDKESKDYVLTYETEITGDVIGYLTEEDVRDLLIRICNLAVSEEFQARIEDQIVEYFKSYRDNEEKKDYEEILLQERQDYDESSSSETVTFVA